MDLWETWEERLRGSGRPARVASELTDAELLNYLCLDTVAATDPAKLVLKQEALRRLQGRPHDPGEPAPSGPPGRA